MDIVSKLGRDQLPAEVKGSLERHHSNCIREQFSTFKTMCKVIGEAPPNSPSTKTTTRTEALKALMGKYLTPHGVSDYGQFLDGLRSNTNLEDDYYTDGLLGPHPHKAKFRARSSRVWTFMRENGRKLWKDESERHLGAVEDFIATQKTEPIDEPFPEDVIDKAGNPVNALAVPCFTVPQGAAVEDTTKTIIFTKQRCITDQRARNHRILVRSKQLPLIALCGILCFQAMFQVVSSGLNASFGQFRKDVDLDFANLLRENFKWRPKVCSYCTPWVSKLDFSSYFHCFRTQQAISLYLYYKGRSIKFLSDRCGFGSLHSIYIATRLSAALQLILNLSLFIALIIYIDDSILLSPSPVVAQMHVFMVSQICIKLGIPLAAKKLETRRLDLDICVLGLVLCRSNHMTTFTVQMKQVAMTSTLLDEAAALALECKLTTQLIQTIAGRLMHMLCTFGRRNELQLLASVLMPFAVDAWLKSNTRRRFIRKTLVFLLGRIKELLPLAHERPTSIMPGEILTMTSVTDASLSGPKGSPEVGLGGFVSFETNPDFNFRPELRADEHAFNVWSIEDRAALVKEVPAKDDIFLHELVAVVLNIFRNVRLFRRALPQGGRGIILTVLDNQAVLFAILKNTTRIRSCNFVTILSLLRILTSSLYDKETQTTIQLVLHYVRSKLNPADLLTRLKQYLKKAEHVFPNGFKAIDDAEEVFPHQAQKAICR